MKKPVLLFIFSSLLLFTLNCEYQSQEQSNTDSVINTAHLDSLYEKINVGNNTIGIIHIYSEYPDYKWVGDSDEGIACVDDAARAAVFYLKYSELYGRRGSLIKARRLIEFIMYMQADNAFFHNFISDDCFVY